MKIKFRDNSRCYATIEYDSDFQEWLVRFFVDGKQLVNACYITDDEQDAQGSARAGLEHLANSYKDE